MKRVGRTDPIIRHAETALRVEGAGLRTKKPGGDYFTERSGREGNGTERKDGLKYGTDTGLKCGTAKSRNMEGGAVTVVKHGIWRREDK